MSEDDVSQITLDVITLLGDLFDEHMVQSSLATAYTAFVQQSHAYIVSIQHMLPEHEIYLVRDVHHDLLHEAFVKHFKNPPVTND